MDWTKKEVASLELSKRLKELGFPQNKKGWRWIEILEEGKTSNWHLISPYEPPEEYAYVKGDIVNQVIYAPTVRELGEWLPPYWISWRDKKGRYWINRIREFKCVFNSEDYPELSRPIAVALENFIKREYTPTYNEANARAKLLIFLREIGYITSNQKDKNNA